MAVTNGSYDEFLNALRAQATPAPTPTGGAIDLRNRLFSPTPVPAPTPPAPKPRADMGIDYTPTGTVAAPAAPVVTDVFGNPQTVGRGAPSGPDIPWANFGVMPALGDVGGMAAPPLKPADYAAVPSSKIAPSPVDANTTPLADRAGPSVGKQGPYPAPAPVYNGFMDPRTHSLEEFVAANKDITMREALGIMKANPQNGPQGRIQQMLLGLAEAQHARDVAAAGNDKAEQAKADLVHMQRLGIIASGGANGAMQYNMIRSPN